MAEATVDTIQEWDEATLIAASLLFGKSGGLRTWPWYEASLDRIQQEIGRDDMMHEAAAEVFRLRREGHTVFETRRRAEAYLRGLWRPRFEAKSSRYEPPTLPIEEAIAVSYTMDDQEQEADGRRAASAAVAAIRMTVTTTEWEALSALAAAGSVKGAATSCGVSRQTVWRAVVKAREAASCYMSRV